ncbi:MAG: ferredoxin, partial [Candidatus Electrothrix sp. LOE2]|nr:ferredoxin [Candidatus Electrothrix sp. LOE2]
MLIIDTTLCIGCGACEANCAFGAITVEDGVA